MKRLTRFSMRTLLLLTLVCAGAAYGARDHVVALWSNWTSVSPSFTSNEGSAWDSVESMHAFYTQNFVESEGFGISRRLDFDASERRYLMVDGKRHNIHWARLVGLRKDPVIYESNWAGVQFPGKHLDKLTDAETRPLTRDEEKAVLRLRLGEDYVWVPGEGDRVPMLYGALRASKTCAQCHEVDSGTLLGAFAYSLLDEQFKLKQVVQGSIDRS